MKFTSAYEPDKFEPEIYKEWESSGAFDPKAVDKKARTKASHKTTSSETYSIVMPPPNANGNLHIGHGLTIAIEDSLTRYYRMKGNTTWYIPGADHAGFETWVVYERKLEQEGHTRFEYSRDELYARVWNFVEEQRGNMELQLRALGASCAWNDLTFTLDENVVSRTYKTFEKMWNDGLIYRGKKLVNYCPKHQTAFADIEIDHIDEPGFLWDIKYNIVEESESSSEVAKENPLISEGVHERAQSVAGGTRTALRSARLDDDRNQTGFSQTRKKLSDSSLTYIVVSTTRPETLFGDQAVAVNPNDPRYKSLIGKHVRLPLTSRTIPIIPDEHADPEYGSGVVKITPAHDFDDFEVGQRHNLELLRVIDDEGNMTADCGETYAGLSTTACRKLVLKDLKAAGLLLDTHKISHSVAHCYKCGTVIEPTLKEQWFINTDPLKTRALKALKHNEIAFYPASKKSALITYFENLKDWNISRQIPWGIPIPMFKKQGTESAGTGQLNNASSPDWLFDPRTNLKEIEIGGVKYLRDEDTFDTWFSSSHWPIVCTDWTEETGSPFYPLNVMETGADILFAWIARMLMIGLYVTDEVPFREVCLHGLVLDAHGKKMSKSKGNVINPLELVSKYGSDAFRLGILRGRTMGLAQAFSEDSVKTGRNLCNKLWNISRLIDSWAEKNSKDSNTFSEASKENSQIFRGDYEGARSMAGVSRSASRSARLIDEKNLPEFSQAKKNVSNLSSLTVNMSEDWICREISNLISTLDKNLSTYRFSESVEALHECIWDKYADWFLESEKLFKNLPLLKLTLETLLKAAHPFMPFVTETIWQSLSWTSGLLINQSWAEPLDYDPISAESFERLKEAITEVRRVKNDLPGSFKSKSFDLLYGDDSLIADNADLVKLLTKCPNVLPTSGAPKGIRLALVGRELYLDVDEKTVKNYKSALTDRILSVGKDLNALEARMLNPRYVDKAPKALVEETRKGIEEKKSLISRLRQELDLIA
ncbi:valine--tRNA ligase [Candidatus Saccharibacteria bacterium]|nr:valine--tRNA ligase [Candidatus Saccharibacteria bacterium]